MWDVRRCAEEKLADIAQQLRCRIVSAVERNGGHLASNLGAVELTIAIHRSFDPSRDRILFDVSHQCYAHKLLTGRAGARFDGIRRAGGYSGYCDAGESPMDLFTAGHEGTALSAALGLAAARDRLGGSGYVVAVLGDGSLSCGLTQEALQHAGKASEGLIIIINDNGYAIDPAVGAWSEHLSSLAAGSTSAPCAFRDLYGLEYLGPADGHSFAELLPLLERARACRRPALVHLRTRKGRGHPAAERSPVKFHSIGPADGGDGSALSGRNSYGDALGACLCEFAAADSRIVAVSAAMGYGTGLQPFAEKFPNRFFDVAIAEGHALTFAAGLARGGLRPVCAIYSTFVQRAVDNFFHDVCLQDLPLLLCLDRAGLCCYDGDSHHGLFDIALLSPFPNCIIAQPSTFADFRAMLWTALRTPHPFVIRYPRGVAEDLPSSFPPPRTMEIGRAAVLRDGAEVSLWALGPRRLRQAFDLAALLENAAIGAEVVDGRFAVPLDRDALSRSARCRLLVSLEDHVARGGFGSLLLRALGDFPRRPDFLPIAWPFPIGFAECNGLLEERCGQSTEQIFQKILARLARGKSWRIFSTS